MAYFAPDSWYEPDIEPESPADFGWVHEDDLPNLNHCKEMLEGLIKAIYKTGNVESLEDCLDELTSQFDLKIPETAPVLGNTVSVRTNRMLGEWLQLNQIHNGHLLKTATR